MKENGKLKYSILAALVLAMASLGDSFLYAYLPANYNALGIPAFWVGVILSLNRFSRLFLNGWIAFCLCTYGIKKVTVIATGVAVLTTISYGFVNFIVLWLLVRVGWGLAFSTLRLSAIVYAFQHKKKGISSGFSKSFIALGPVIALAIGPILINQFDRPYTFLLFGLVGAAAIVLAFCLPEIQVPSVTRKELSLSFPSFFNMLVASNAFVVEGAMVVLLSGILRNNFSLNSEAILLTIGFCLAYRRISLLVFSPLAGWMADKWGFEKIFNYTTILMIAGIALVATGISLPGLIITFTFSGMNSAVSPGGALSTQDRILKDISDNATWRDIGSALGTLTGSLFLETPFVNPFFIIVSILLTAALVLHMNVSPKNYCNGSSRSVYKIP
ncbi:MAG TPA: hypothetical protein VD905_05095 [Flavobacteriales bacterium]|nr:hypothetical protein [Flavobacteriales bacterium]